jgi:carbon-monoxide dehydrogenase medium subunit
MQTFEYKRPGDLAAAKRILADDDEAKLLGGGQSLLPMMKLDLAFPTQLVSLAGIPELQGIRREGDALVIGAASTHAEVAASAEVQAAIPALAALAGNIGDPQVRNRGTLGGSVAHADPAADYPAALIALGATIHTERGQHDADGFFQGLFECALAEDEIVTAVSFPIPEAAAYQKFPHPASRFALVGVFVAETRSGVRVAVTGASGSAFRVAAIEAALTKDFSTGALDDLSIETPSLRDDADASAEYRAHLITLLARRAVAAAK